MKKSLLIKGIPVLLDGDVAKLLGTNTRALNQTMKRGQNGIVEGTYYKVSEEDFKKLKSQGLVSKHNYKSTYVFTEEGLLTAAMMTHTPKAAKVAVELVRYYFDLKTKMMGKSQNEWFTFS